MRQASTSYVPASAPVAPATEPARPTRASEVGAQVLENALAGVGAGVAWAALCLVVWGAIARMMPVEPWPDAIWVALSSVLIAAIVGGLLTAVRFGGDEALATWDKASMKAYIVALEDGIVLRDATIADERRLRKVAESQAAVFSSRLGQRQVQRVEPEQRLGKEWEDAQQLIMRHYNGSKWSRDALVDSGWTPTQWEAAMTVVSRSGVAVKSGRAWVPWDKRATVTQALAAFQAYRQQTIDALAGGVARQSDDATTHDDDE